MKTQSIFIHTAENPFHISVGAVLVNEDGKILVHKAVKAKVPEGYAMGELEEVYFLMRESLENNETLEDAAHRGLQEEFGVKGEIQKYLGSTQVHITQGKNPFEKTTIYFQMLLTSQGERPEDEESFTELEWVEPEFLLEKMRAQGVDPVVAGWGFDESKIVETYVKHN